MNLAQIFVFMISRLKLGHLRSKTRSPGQIKGKPCEHSSSHIFEAIILNLALNVCLDEFKVKFETGSLGVKNLVTRPNQQKTLLTL